MLWSTVKRTIYSTFSNSALVDGEEEPKKLELTEERVIVVGHKPFKHLVSGDLNTFITLNFLSDLKNVEFDPDGVPTMTNEGGMLPFLITTESHTYFATALEYLDKIGLLKTPSAEELAWQLIIEEKLILPFYRWLWNDQRMFNEFTQSFYGGYLHPLIRRYHMRRIYGQFYGYTPNIQVLFRIDLQICEEVLDDASRVLEQNKYLSGKHQKPADVMLASFIVFAQTFGFLEVGTSLKEYAMKVLQL